MIKTLLKAAQALRKLAAMGSKHRRIQFICRNKIRPRYEKISKILLKIQQREERLIKEALNLHIKLEDFARKHRKIWPKKSLKMTHKTIGFHENVKVKASRKTVQLLLDLGYGNYARIRRNADCERMCKLNEDILYQADAQRSIEDRFYVSTIKNGG